jgi:hypothetical protein
MDQWTPVQTQKKRLGRGDIKYTVSQYYEFDTGDGYFNSYRDVFIKNYVSDKMLPTSIQNPFLGLSRAKPRDKEKTSGEATKTHI